MFKRSLIAVMALFITVFAAGCGDDKPKISADKSILAWTELYATGTTAHLAEAGIPKSSEDYVKETLDKLILDSVKDFPLNEANLKEAANYYFKHVKDITKIQTTLKKDDAKNPIVEVKATTIDNNAKMDDLLATEGISTLMATVQAAAAQNKTIEDMKNDTAFQNIALESVKLFIDSCPTIERTLDVKCVLGKGDEDGKLYWMPENPEALAVFAQGR